jgi:hypothetical protein
MMRKFLFEGFWNADFSNQLGFDSLGFRSGHENSPNAEPVATTLPASTGSAAPGASFASDCVLLNAISTPVTQQEPDLEVLDPIFASPLQHELTRKKKKSSEFNRHFQDSWVAKLP